MSLDATRWAWGAPMPAHTPASRKFVLLALADRANDNKQSWPSIRRIAADTLLDRKTVLEAVNDLERLGLLHIKKVKGRGSVYTLNTSPKTGTGTETGTSTKSGTTPVPIPAPHQYRNRDTEPTNESIINSFVAGGDRDVDGIDFDVFDCDIDQLVASRREVAA